MGNLLTWGLSPPLLVPPAWPSTGPFVRVFDTGVAFLLKEGFLCHAPVPGGLGTDGLPVMEMPLWVWRVGFSSTREAGFHVSVLAGGLRLG